jgi:protein TonB
MILVALTLALAACSKAKQQQHARVDTTLPSEATEPATVEQANAVAPVVEDTPASAGSAVSGTEAPAESESSEGADEDTAGPTEKPAGEEITQPDWVRRPSAEDVERYYPERAQRMNIEGRASISCTVDARGTLNSCSVSAETPSDAGFGDAALRMSKLFKMRPMTKDGSPSDGGKITIPIAFTLPRG